MPVYSSGTCFLCGEESDKLLPHTGFDEKGNFVAGFLCPHCTSFVIHEQEKKKHGEARKHHHG